VQHASLITAKGPHGSNGRSCKSSIFCHALALRIRIRELPARNPQNLPLRAKRRKRYAPCWTPQGLLPNQHREITILADEKNKKNPQHNRKSQTRTQQNWQRIWTPPTRRDFLSRYYFRERKTRDEQEDRCDSSRNTRQHQQHPPQTLAPSKASRLLKP
jgi:hypothetical protein